MLNENVTKVLETSMWDLSTCADGEPNVVPVAFKFVTKDGKLAVGDVFLDTTLRNLRENNGKIAVSVYDASSLEDTRSKVQRNTSPRARSSKSSGRWWKRCSTAQHLPRAHCSSHRKR